MTLTTRQFLKDWQITAVIPAALLLCVVQIFIITRAVPVTSQPVVLRSTVYFGASKIGQWWELFIPPLAVAGCILLNGLISFVLYEKNRVFTRFFSWFSLFLVLLLGASTFVVSTSKLIS